MEAVESKSEHKSPFGGKKLVQISKDFFSYSGDIDRRVFAKRILYVAIAAVVSGFWFEVLFIHYVLLLGTLASLASLLVRRLRNLKYHWAIVFIGVVPVLGWIALSIIVVLKARSDIEDPPAKGTVFLAAPATFISLLILLILIPSGLVSEPDDSSTSSETSQSAEDAATQQEALEALEAQAEADAEAEASRLAQQAEDAQASKPKSEPNSPAFEQCLKAWEEENRVVQEGILDDATLIATAQDCLTVDDWKRARIEVGYNNFSPTVILALCGLEPNSPMCLDAVARGEVEVGLTVEDIRESVIPLVFESTRAGIIEVLTDMTVVQSVDLYSYDPAAGTVTLDVTPEFDFDKGVRDDAWEFFRIFAGAFYKAGSDNDAWTLEDPRFAPNFRVTVSSATYECDGETMRDLADSMLSRTDWETTCRVR